MRSGRSIYGGVVKVGGCLLLLGGTVLAQSRAEERPGPWQAGPPVEVQVPLRPALPPEELLRAGTDYRKAMSAVIDQIEDQLRVAREEKDLIKVNCLSDKLIQAKANLNVADKSFSDMQDSIRRDNEGNAFYQYSRIAILNQNVQTLVMEAASCVGADLSFVGAVRIEVTTENVPAGDPTKPGDDDDDTAPPVTRPPPASPFI